MGDYYLAIDIGASSGRHILATYDKGKIISEEIYRFENKMYTKEGQLCWQYDTLFEHIIEGLKKCKQIGKVPKSIGIDTWAVDFVLLDCEDQVIGNMVAYRDKRTEGMDTILSQTLSEKDLYQRTGIQKQIFNSIYQLMAIKEKEPSHWSRAKTFLMVPDYFNFLLTGRKTNEYTNATTTGLMCSAHKSWDTDLMRQLDFPEALFQDIVMPGTLIGTWTEEITKRVGYEAMVMATTSHDTASAVVAIPSTEDHPLYISSGTWSLMGTELIEPITTLESQSLNFTNEGGYKGRFRYLKNIMGLWMIQNVKAEIGQDLSYESICQQASQSTLEGRVDCNDARFLAPENMTKAIQDYLKESGKEVPYGIGDVSKVIYDSLAHCYHETLIKIQEITGQNYESIYIVGGGSNADYLNQLTHQITHKRVVAGPCEGTALGNIIVQMLTDQVFDNLKEARKCLYDSCDIKIYGRTN